MIEIIRHNADIAMVMLIWLVQLIIYPGFHAIEESRFLEWHKRYIRVISTVVIPLMLTQLTCIVLQLLESLTVSAVVSAAAAAAAWLVTFTVSAPCHRTLQERGKNAGVIDRLIATNWYRTVGWTIVWLAG